MANLIGWGIAIAIIGLLLTFSNVFGFVAGGPLVSIGVLLIVVGVIVGIAHFFMGSTRGGMTRRGAGPRL